MKKAWMLDWDLQLPNFAAPIVLLKVGLLANVCMLVGAILRQDQTWSPLESFMSAAAVGEPALLLSMLILALLWPRSSAKTRSFLALFVGSFSVGTLSFFQPEWSWGQALHSMLNAILVSMALCMYFDWRHRKLSPALAEAKMDALVSRMRPHFLFNAINGIVMLLNKSPADAEEALLDLSDVFRALLKEGSGLAKLGDEIDLTKKYLRIEKMRFRDRMTVNFNVDEEAKAVLIPTMLLQPLVENAVIHGIETVESGSIDISATVRDGRIFISIENPYAAKQKKGQMRKSNGIAMENIKQRLSLIYDMEAKFSCSAKDGSTWCVSIQLPAYEKIPEGVSRIL